MEVDSGTKEEWRSCARDMNAGEILGGTNARICKEYCKGKTVEGNGW